MGNIDAVTKEYLKNPKVVADIGNFVLYEGEQRILPERLREMDTAMLTVPYGTNHAALPAQKFRDKMMAMVDETNQIVCLILGNEAEGGIRYAEPVKNLYYDAAEYADQVTRAGLSRKQERKENRKTREAKEIRKRIIEQLKAEGWSPSNASGNSDFNMEEVLQAAAEVLAQNEEAAAAREAFSALENEFAAETAEKSHPTSGEFLGNFHKTDRLVPVITIVLHLSPEHWDGPRTLQEMFGDIDEALLRHLPDYHINLISPEELSEEQLSLFQTDLREVLLCIKYSKDKKKLHQLMETKRFRSISPAALDVINKATNSNIPYVLDQKGDCDMCEGLRGMLEDERTEGKVEDIKNVMESFKVSCENAMKALKIPEADFPKYRAMM